MLALTPEQQARENAGRRRLGSAKPRCAQPGRGALEITSAAGVVGDAIRDLEIIRAPSVVITPKIYGTGH